MNSEADDNKYETESETYDQTEEVSTCTLLI
jgi:hypothetical protein